MTSDSKKPLTRNKQDPMKMRLKVPAQLLQKELNFELARPDTSETESNLSKYGKTRKTSKTSLGLRFDKKNPMQSSASNLTQGQESQTFKNSNFSS